MKAVSIREMRAKLSRLEDVLASEGEVTITKHGKAIARVLPVARAGRAIPSHDALRAKMRPLRVGSEHAVRADRDER